jgi:hypothetical protein
MKAYILLSDQLSGLEIIGNIFTYSLALKHGFIKYALE